MYLLVSEAMRKCSMCMVIVQLLSVACVAFATDSNNYAYGLLALLHAKDANRRMSWVECHSYMLSKLHVATRVSFA